MSDRPEPMLHSDDPTDDSLVGPSAASPHSHVPPIPASGAFSLEKPGYVDGIPVQQLVKETREFIARITDKDRERLAADLTESGHQRSIQSGAPYLLQGFFTGRLDLDVELTRRYPSPPLLSNATFAPKPGQQRRHGFAQFASQDTASTMTIEIHTTTGALEISFLLYSMIGVHFTLGAIAEPQRKRFLDLMTKDDAIVFLWTTARWEQDYVIFVIRGSFARMYAFGPGRVEAACRLTPDNIEQLRTWLGGFWNEPEDDSPTIETRPPNLNW